MLDRNPEFQNRSQPYHWVMTQSCAPVAWLFLSLQITCKCTCCTCCLCRKSWNYVIAPRMCHTMNQVLSDRLAWKWSWLSLSWIAPQKAKHSLRNCRWAKLNAWNILEPYCAERSKAPTHGEPLPGKQFGTNNLRNRILASTGTQNTKLSSQFINLLTVIYFV